MKIIKYLVLLFAVFIHLSNGANRASPPKQTLPIPKSLGQVMSKLSPSKTPSPTEPEPDPDSEEPEQENVPEKPYDFLTYQGVNFYYDPRSGITKSLKNVNVDDAGNFFLKSDNKSPVVRGYKMIENRGKKYYPDKDGNFHLIGRNGQEIITRQEPYESPNGQNPNLARSNSNNDVNYTGIPKLSRSIVGASNVKPPTLPGNFWGNGFGMNLQNDIPQVRNQGTPGSQPLRINEEQYQRNGPLNFNANNGNPNNKYGTSRETGSDPGANEEYEAQLEEAYNFIETLNKQGYKAKPETYIVNVGGTPHYINVHGDKITVTPPLPEDEDEEDEEEENLANRPSPYFQPSPFLNPNSFSPNGNFYGLNQPYGGVMYGQFGHPFDPFQNNPLLLNQNLQYLATYYPQQYQQVFLNHLQMLHQNQLLLQQQMFGFNPNQNQLFALSQKQQLKRKPKKRQL